MIKSLATVKIWMQWSSAPIYPCGSADFEEAREEDLSDSQTQQLIATPPPAPLLKFPSGQYVAKKTGRDVSSQSIEYDVQVVHPLFEIFILIIDSVIGA